jgi:hypothetical protein
VPTSTNYRDPDRGFHYWARGEVVSFGGPWVPNVGDKLFDEDQGDFLITEVDYTTGESKMRPWFAPTQPTEEGVSLTLTGHGPGTIDESYRAFLDQTVTPHTLSPDVRLHTYATDVTHYKMFLGTDTSEEFGKVISTFFDPSGNFLGESVPFEEMQIPGALHKTVRIPSVGFTSEQLSNGEIVTLVPYRNGTPASKNQLVIVNSSANRQADTSKRYIKAIALESPFLSSADPQTIEFPINVTVESLPMTAVVYYSDGSKNRMSVQNSKFQLLGLNDYIATEVGQKFPLVLKYTLAEDEVSYNLTPALDRSLVMDYTATTTTADGAYEVKLFVYPFWVSAAKGYRLEFWMYNLDRQTFYNVTPYVELGVNSNAFDPLAFGVIQKMTYALDLNKVDGRFAPHRHVQNVQLALLNGGADTANWEVFFTPNQAQGYGRDLIADLEYVNTNSWRLRLANGITEQALWLKTLFERTEPLYNPDLEAIAPDPTHFRLVFAHNTYEFAVSQWNQALVVNNDLANGELLLIQWLRRTYETDLQLATTALVVRQRGQ